MSEKLIQQLYDNRFLQTDKEFALFETARSQLEHEEGLAKEHLSTLLKIYNDSVQDNEVFWSLLHVIERKFDWEYFVKVLVEMTPLLTKQAPNWLRTWYTRNINHEETRQYLIQVLLQLPSEERCHICKLLQTWQDETNVPYFLENIRYVLAICDCLDNSENL